MSKYVVHFANGYTKKVETVSMVEARRVLKEVKRWDRLFLSHKYTTDHGCGWSCYSNKKDLDGDRDGAYAPMIEKIEHEGLL